jgi:hypothetical protein
MHDIDRTQLLLDSQLDEAEADQFEYGVNPELEAGSTVFDEAEEMELAAELLGVSDDRELEAFIGNLLHQAGRSLGRTLESGVKKNLSGFLKGAAKAVLPIAGTAVGTMIGGPAGGAIGNRLASTAGQVLGLELEGLSPEDQEFEAARGVIRLASEAAKQAVNANTGRGAKEAARDAVAGAAQKFAPGLLKPAQPTSPGAPQGPLSSSGRWVRENGKIVLLGL